MIHKTTPYILVKDGTHYVFDSEKSACDFLGVPKCTVASSFRYGSKCKGHSVIKGVSEQEIYNDRRLRKIWESMLERCEYQKHKHFKTYGGNGITVCKDWHKYIPFAKWAFSNGYSPELTIDRIDNSKGYAPDNCRWVTYKQQANNKTTNVRLEYNGVSKTMSEWAELLGMNYTTLKERIRSGWSVEKALETPVRPRTAKMKGAEDGTTDNS